MHGVKLSRRRGHGEVHKESSKWATCEKIVVGLSMKLPSCITSWCSSIMRRKWQQFNKN